MIDVATAQMEKCLRKLVIDLIPSDEYISLGKELVEKVKKLLLRRSRYTFDRAIYAGSVGKHTESMSADFDVVLFLNDEKHPFDDVLTEWEQILMMNEGDIQIDEDSIKKTSHSIQFSLKDQQVDVDLLPATNFVPRHLQSHQPSGEDLAKVQQAEVTKVMNALNHKALSSSLSESQIYFMKRQSEFTHQIVRLGKFWYKTLYLGPQMIYGVKSVLELIATSVGIEEGAKQPNSLVRAFDSFLLKVEGIDKLRLAFKQNINGNWEIRKPTHEDPEHFVIEPANPFNNLASNFSEREREVANLKKFAQQTRKKFWEIIHGNFTSSTFADIFRNLPKNGPVFAFPRGQLRICGGEDSSYRRYVGTKQVWNEQKIKKGGREMQETLKTIQSFLETNVRAVASSVAVTNESNSVTSNISQVEKQVHKLLTEDILRQKYTPWGGGGERHEDCDVTFTVPVSSDKNCGALKFSFKWD